MFLFAIKMIVDNFTAYIVKTACGSHYIVLFSLHSGVAFNNALSYR